MKNEFKIIVGLFSGAADTNDKDDVDHFGLLRIMPKKRQKLSTVQLEDLPNEVLLEIFQFLNIRQILKFGQVSRRIRAVSNNESLWLKLNFSGANIPYELVEKAVDNGCKYLSVAHGRLYGVQNSKLPLNLKYLDTFGNGIELIKNCRSLEKLSLGWINPIDTTDTIENIGKNGQTLKVLHLRYALDLQNVGNRTKAIEELFKSCVELNELNLRQSFSWRGEFLNAMVNNLTPNIRKVDLGNCKYLQDKHVKLLVERCNRITELKLAYTSVTNDSLESIATHLNSSLEKLDVSYTKIDSTALLQLKSVGTLKVLICICGTFKVEENEKLKSLKKNLPQLSINKEKFYVTTNLVTSSQEVCSHENGFWEIKAKAQKLFQK